MGEAATGMFRSFANRDFRLWVGASFVSNIGNWMQGTAQNWLVLTELTDHSAAAMGMVTALQFLPQVLLVLFTGTLADHVDRRKLLIAIQCAMGLIALTLGLVVLTGVVRLWHVYGFAFCLGCGMAFEAPARHSFVAELVGDGDIGNAVALNGTAFQLARTVGPAIAGLSIALFGTGWVFLVNGLSYLVVIAALLRMHAVDRRAHPATGRAQVRLLDGFRYVRARPDIRAVFLMLFLMGALGMNFGVFIAVMSVEVFRKGAAEYGLLSSVMAVGSVVGALLAARRERPLMRHLIGGAALFGSAMTLAALAPSFLFFGLLLMLVGGASQTMLTSANGFVQLATDRAMRGRVMAIHVAILFGGLPLGAPLVGWVADHAGARWAMELGALAGFAAALTGIVYMVRVRGLRLVWDGRGPRLVMDRDPDPVRERLPG